MLAIKERFRIRAMKAIAVAGEADLDHAKAYLGVADWLMFDAKPPKDRTDAMPGGNALAFDWRLMRARRWPVPWMLSGGLDPDNLAEARDHIRRGRARCVVGRRVRARNQGPGQDPPLPGARARAVMRLHDH